MAVAAASILVLLLLACGSESPTEPPATSAPPATAPPATTGPMPTATAGAEPTSAPEPTEPSAAPSQPELSVVTTSNILADWVKAVGQDRVSVFALIPADADPHTYSPGAQDITRVSGADLVVVIGLSVEEASLEKLMGRAIRNPDSIVALGQYVDPLESGDTGADHSHAGGGDTHEHGPGSHEHGPLDPHFWMDPVRVKLAVDVIAESLSKADPDGSDIYSANAEDYNQELDGLHAWILEQVQTVPEERRLLVTAHESFQYFAVRYEFDVVGTVFPLSTEREPSAQEIVQLIEAIEQAGAPAVFTEAAIPARLSERVADETGVTLVGGLHTGSLTEEGNSDTYLEMMRVNTEVIVGALQ